MDKETVIVYGAGYMGKKLLPYIQEKYKVLCFADKKAELWNSKIEDITVCPLSNIRERTEKILITTMWNSYVDIVPQLIDEMIDSQRIFFAQYSERERSLYIVPFYEWEPKQVCCNLKEYDLLAKEEKKNANTVLILCSFYSVYVDRLIKNVKRRYPEVCFSILTQSTEYLSTIKDEVQHIYCYGIYDELYSILVLLPQYDAFQALWIEDVWTVFEELIRSKCRKLNLHVGGSDLYRSSQVSLKRKGEIIDRADNITAETQTTIADFLMEFPYAQNKTELQFFGLDTIEYQISILEQRKMRERLRISNNRLVITCGHNGTRQHRHREIIQAILRMKKEIIDQCFFVFPMTYGDRDGTYTQMIKKEVEKATFQGAVLTDFMNAYDMACYARLSDVMIHVITTDQLSSTMLEELYAGSVVITGSWLPYQMLAEKGLFFVTINEISELKDTLQLVIENLADYKERCINNKNIIEEMFSWDKVSEQWKDRWIKI